METTCDKCNNRTILMTGTVYANPDEEPYESGVYEKVSDEIDTDVEFGVYFQWCPYCKRTDEINHHQFF